MRTPDEQREYMKLYMRRRRHPELCCQVCGKRLVGQQTKFCGRPCRVKDYYNRHKATAQARYRRWHRANAERSVARVRAWRLANPGRSLTYVKKWRTQECPFCGGNLCWPARACRKCTIRFGCLCHDNPQCEVAEKHKHCPCGMPVKPNRHYQIEPCKLCQADMDRLGISLAEMFRTERDLEEAA
jgi:hypothetical protein